MIQAAADNVCASTDRGRSTSTATIICLIVFLLEPQYVAECMVWRGVTVPALAWQVYFVAG
jgi:hypothetical protein